MKPFRIPILAFVLFVFTWNLALGQEVDKNLIIGKWKFVKATIGYYEKDYQYNGEPLLTFDNNGRWSTEDSNPNYRQSGTWEIELNNLIRDPDKTEKRDIPRYARGIEKLTPNELVLSALSEAGLRTFTFYFIKIE